MIKRRGISRVIYTIVLTLFAFISVEAQQVINLPASKGDSTLKLRRLLEKAHKEEAIKVVLEDATYTFKPDYAFEKYCALTNHGNGSKRILFPLNGFKSVEIVGNGATLICHGQMMPFLFEMCQEVKVSNLTINWDIPFTFLAEVMDVNPEEGWREVKPLTKGYSWRYANNKILFPNIDGFNYAYLGSTLPFDKESKRVVKGAIDIHSNASKIEKLKNGNLRIYEKLRYYPPVGSMLSSKGDREHDRYAPAFDFKECRNIVLDGITIHHALGMAFLFERSENIKLLNSNVVVEKGSPRVISSTADASHFANCKGDVLIENCRFENMLDDGTNVHGTYVEVVKRLNDNKLRVALKHFEQLGFNFAEAGDEMWFILQPDPSRHSVGKVTHVRVINEQYMDLTFATPVPEAIKQGDYLENKTWSPTFTMRGCTIQNIRARAVVLKTPLKTVIENNYFSPMMSAILFRGETFSWFESGAVEDVLIQNNTFKNAADCGTPHAVLYITPKLGKHFDASKQYDRNIRFINNTIDTYSPRIVWADRVDGLEVSGNTIIRNNEGTPVFPNDPMFELVNSKHITIEKNKYTGEAHPTVLRADEVSKASLTIKKNRGITIE